MEEYKHSDLTHKIIGCAMQTHSFLGNGFQEVIYQRALALELLKAGLKFERELLVDIFYKDYIEPIGSRRVDFLVEGLVLVELKALSALDDVHLNQVLNYLRVYKIEIGLLINFGENRLNIKRLILSDKNKLAP
jgi:GxxExxY protein